jgi:hypothetical protein
MTCPCMQARPMRIRRPAAVAVPHLAAVSNFKHCMPPLRYEREHKAHQPTPLSAGAHGMLAAALRAGT